MLINMILKLINFLFGLLPVFNVDFTYGKGLISTFWGYCINGFKLFMFLSYRHIVLGCISVIIGYYVFKGGASLVKFIIKIFI